MMSFCRMNKEIDDHVIPTASHWRMKMHHIQTGYNSCSAIQQNNIVTIPEANPARPVPPVVSYLAILYVSSKRLIFIILYKYVCILYTTSINTRFYGW
jgi:hypothetical protein